MAKIKGLDKLLKKFRKLDKDVNKRVEKAVLLGGVDVRNEAIESIARGAKSGKVYKDHLLMNKTTGNLFADPDPAARGKKRRTAPHRASAPGEAPATDSGGLIGSIFSLPISPTKVIVGTLDKVGKFMEFGTPGAERPIAPRPWLNPAFRSKRNKIVKNIIKAMKQAIAENKKR